MAEKTSSYLQESNVKELINEAIEVSWKWVHTEENVGEILYNFLDNEENGFTLFQEMEEDEKNISAWDCIIDAVAYVSRAAYEKEGVNKLKSPFILRADDIQRLSAIEIAEKYALPQIPDKVVYPKIPSDVPLELSIVGPQEAWGTLGGCTICD